MTLTSARSGDALVYGTFLGGELVDSASAVAIDRQGYIHVAGTTQSAQFPASQPYAVQHGVDAYIAKIDPGGQKISYLLWFNAFNAADIDEAFDISLDNAGNAYVTGVTRSADFCALFGDAPGYDTSYNGNGDAFLLKIKEDGSSLAYCTYLGGSDWDSGATLVVNDEGYAIVSGGTWSTDFPTSNDAYQPQISGQRDVFVARFDPSGTRMTYSSYFGGALQEESRAIAMLPNDAVVVTGWTSSPDLPASSDSFEPKYQGAFDAFVTVIEWTGTPSWRTAFIGSSGEDRGNGVAVSDSGQIFLTGLHRSTGEPLRTPFPTTPYSYQQSLNGESDAFLVELSSDLQELTYGSLFGGSGEDEGLNIVLDSRDRPLIGGRTTSLDLITTSQAFQKVPQGDSDAFLAQIEAQTGSLRYVSYLGGSNLDRISDLVFHADESVTLVGATASADFPTSASAVYPVISGETDAFVGRLNLPQRSSFILRLPVVLQGSLLNG